MKHIGIDYGTKKIGIALSDVEGLVAFPYDIILSDDFAPSVVADLVHKENVEAVVIGESKSLQGVLNEVAVEAEEFVKKLKKFTNVDVYFEDERFTTAQAYNVPKESEPRGNIANKGRALTVAKTMADKHAAALILQSFLDKTRQTR